METRHLSLRVDLLLDAASGTEEVLVEVGSRQPHWLINWDSLAVQLISPAIGDTLRMTKRYSTVVHFDATGRDDPSYDLIVLYVLDSSDVQQRHEETIRALERHGRCRWRPVLH